MKKCQQCGTVYTDEIGYCLNDGTATVEDSFSLPSSENDGEPETIIRSEPIIIDFANVRESAQAADYAAPNAENVVVIPASGNSSNRNYVLFLVLGLIIGGGLVLATLLLAKSFSERENARDTKININSAPTAKPEKPKPTVEAADQNENVSIEPTPNRHAEPDDAAAENSNGRVIALNARVRLAPDRDSPIVDVLPMNDRIDIIRRENSGSPWYQIECEHGTSGWMHGDTIEFTR